jgi:hypothetical protein
MDRTDSKSAPLRNPRHELFARARALLMSPQQAALDAGYTDVTPGNAARLDRRKDIQARIAKLGELDEELIRWKRAKIEARLNLVAYIKSYFSGNEMLRRMIRRDTASGLELENRVDIAVSTNSFRAVRGRAILLARFWTK